MNDRRNGPRYYSAEYSPLCENEFPLEIDTDSHYSANNAGTGSRMMGFHVALKTWKVR